MTTFWIKGQLLLNLLGFVIVANGQLYYSGSKTTYEEADKYCSSLGTSLVKIDSQQKYDEVDKIMTDNNINTADVWIGLRSEKSNPTVYLYPDGEVATFFMWDVGEPNQQSTDFCIRIHKNYKKYRTIKCKSTYNFICDSVETKSSFSSIKSKSMGALETTTLATNDTGNKSFSGTSIHSINTWLSVNMTQGYECNECNCTSHVSLSVREIEERLQKIKKSLTLKKSSLSKQTRQKFSAPDKRTSATIVGYVGVTFLAVTFGAIILPDVLSLLKFIRSEMKKREE